MECDVDLTTMRIIILYDSQDTSQELWGTTKALGSISLIDLSLFWGLNVIQMDSWLSLSLLVKSAPEHFSL